MNIGAFGEEFPYTNFHDLNLDWILRMIKTLNTKFDEAISAKIKFADPVEWDITKQYEQLTIVLYDNKAYLSMKPVPSGVDISNSEYWQIIFDMSELYAMIDALQQDVEDQIEQQNDKIDNETVKNNSVKHVLWLGDSYSTWNSGALFNTFANNCGVPTEQIHNLAVSGSGFVSDGTTLFINQLQNYTGDKTVITDIVVCGGINDAKPEYNSSQSVQELTTAMDNFNSYVRQNYPNAIVHIAYVGGCLPTSTYYETLHPQVAQEWALWAYSIYGKAIKWDVLPVWNSIHQSVSNYNTDGLHPNTTGARAIGQTVASAFNKIESPYNRPQEIVYLRATGKALTGLSSFMYIENDIVTISTPDNYIRITQNESISNDQWYPILTLSNALIRPPKFFNCIASINGFNGVTIPKLVAIAGRIQDGVISIKVNSYQANGLPEVFVADSYASITFHCLPDIIFPLWQMN